MQNRVKHDSYKRLLLYFKSFGHPSLTPAIFYFRNSNHTKGSKCRIDCRTWVTVTDVISQHHIEVKEVINKDYCNLLISKFIHKGEAEAITIAIELRADLLLIDELAGRELASQLGIPVTGILGILLTAKNKGLIKEISPVVDALSKNGFRISPALIAIILKEAGELD